MQPESVSMNTTEAVHVNGGGSLMPNSTGARWEIGTRTSQSTGAEESDHSLHSSTDPNVIASLPSRTEYEEEADRVEAELDEMSRWVGPVAKSLFTPVVAPVVDANSFADALGVSPLYKQKESQRWSSALNVYRQMSSSSQDQNYQAKKRLSEDEELAELCLQSSINNNVVSPDLDEHRPATSSRPSAPPPRDVLAAPMPLPAAGWQQNMKKGFATPPAGRSNGAGATYIVSPPHRKSSTVSPGEASLNCLELEAIAAVHELQFAVKDIYVSEMLPRTTELIFLNLTTLEGQAHCVELTMKGWRVTSLRHDCMNGDINHLDLHIQYFETIYALMDRISPDYRRRFTDALMSKLSAIEAERRNADHGPCDGENVCDTNNTDEILQQEMRQTYT